MAESDKNMDNLNPQDPEIEYDYHNWVFDVHYYGIGSTTPPRDYLTVMSGFLILCILLCGMVTTMGLMGVRIAAEPEPTQEADDIFISFTAVEGELPTGLEKVVEETIGSSDWDGEKTAVEENLHIIINGSPESVENIPQQEGALSWQDVYEKVIPSVVSISCTTGASGSSGSGIVMTESGYILTNAHVVEGAGSIQVLLSDGRSFAARIVGVDEVSDLAVIDIEAQNLTPAEFGDSSALRVGDEVVAIGDPLGITLRGTMTDGIVSGISRDLQVNGRAMTLIQTTAALNSGNSGGPLVNCYGQVVGINTMKLIDQTGSTIVEGLGFAIPTGTIQTVVEQLMTQGYVSGRPSLGVEGSMVSRFYQHYYRLPAGLLVSTVDSSSDAAARGIRSGDIILSVNGTRITDLEILDQVIYGCSAGDAVTVTVYRAGRQYELTIILAEDKG